MPPSETGAVQLSATWAFPDVPVSPVTWSGVVAGVAAPELVEYVPVPAAFTAATRKTYDVPFVRPVTVNVVPLEPVLCSADHVLPESLEYWYLYAVTALPPFEAGAVQERIALALPRVAVRDVGVPGTVNGVTAPEFDEYAPVPMALTAATRKM